MSHGIILKKVRISKGLANRKGWVFSSNTPHQVHNIKWQNREKLASLFNRGYAVLSSAESSPFIRNSLWAETENRATLLEKNLLNPLRYLSPF